MLKLKLNVEAWSLGSKLRFQIDAEVQNLKLILKLEVKTCEAKFYKHDHQLCLWDYSSLWWAITIVKLLNDRVEELIKDI